MPTFFPEGTVSVGTQMKANALIAVLGRSGVGKSHLIRQLLLDPDFGIDEVLVLMAEDSTSTYNVEGVKVRRVQDLRSLDAAVREIINRPKGTTLPKLIAVDSLSGAMDYQRRSYKAQPILTGKGEVDVRAQFGDMGYMGMDCLIELRDAVESDILVLVTTHEQSGSLPEFAIEGKLLPKNFVRLTNVTLHLRTERSGFDPASQTVTPKPWRTIGDGVYIDRAFYTQDTGEIQAKGHHNLRLKEPAYLPDIIRMIHGEKPTIIQKETSK